MGEQKMTADEATHFDRYSQMHAAVLEAAAEERGCGCEAYSDWYTYNRWAAQGFQVQKGEHGVPLTTYIPIQKKGEDGEAAVVGTRPRTVRVFCRHQVKSK